MRVIVWGINYAPELTGISPYNVALCEFLQNRGDDVEMITTFPYYPSWRKRPEDRGALYRTDIVNGVTVRRCWHFVPERVSAMKRIVHEGTFVLTSTLRALSRPAADIYVIVSPPLLLGAAAWFLTRIERRSYVFHVQDLQPDAAVGLGMLREGWFTRALYALEAFAYRHAVRVSSISSGMLDIFRKKGVPEAKLLYVPNSIRLPDPATLPARGEFRQRFGISGTEFLASYAGNLGVKQGLDILLDTAEQLVGSNIRILICGDGAERPKLEAEINRRNLSNVTMAPLQAGRDYSALLIDSDICFITQQAGVGNAFFPSKLLGILAHGRGVVTVADAASELAQAVTREGIGVNVPSRDATAVATALRAAASDPARLAHFATAGANFVAQFEHERVLGDFARELEKLSRPSAAASERAAVSAE